MLKAVSEELSVKVSKLPSAGSQRVWSKTQLEMYKWILFVVIQRECIRDSP